jgi:hypothetical protein
LGGGDLGVAEEFLDGADVIAGFEEMGGEGVAEGVAADWFGDLGELDCGTNGALEDLLVEVMAAGFAGARIDGKACGGEGVLPGPLAGSARIFTIESVGQVDFAEAIGEVFFVQNFDAGEVFAQGRFENFRQEGDAVFIAFAVADDDLVEVEIDILDAEAEAFHEAEAGAVKEFGEELVGAGHGCKEAVGFIARHDDGQAGGAFGADELIHPLERLMEDFVVKKDNGVESLVLGGGGDFLVNGEVGKEGLNLGSTHFAWMPFLMEEDEAFDPEDVDLFGAEGVVFDAEDFADLVEEFGFGVGNDEGGGVDGSGWAEREVVRKGI